MTVRLAETTPLVEAASGQPASRRFRARLIEAEVQGSSGYYPADTLRRSAGAFPAGTQVFCDHPSMTEAADRPERSVKDLAGRLATDAVFDRDGLYAEVEVFPHYAPLIEGVADAIGMSIRAMGTSEPSRDESIRGPIITSLTEGISVDFVTKAGAGGKVLELIESAREQAPAEPLDEAPDAGPARGEQTPAEEAAEPPTREELREAGRTVGARLEGRIHTSFTVMADDLYCDGRLTRDERITLSSAFGDALAAFVKRVEGDAPQLYQRDPWSFPPDEDETAVAEAAKKKPPFPPFKKGDDASDDEDTDDLDDDGDNTDGDDTDGDPKATRKRTKSAQGGKPAPKEKKEGAMPEITDEQLRQLNEAADTKTRMDEAAARLDQATQLIETQGKQITDLQAQLAESAKRDLVRDNAAAARALCEEALAGSGLPTRAHAKIINSVTRSLPVGEDGALDRDALTEAIKTEVQDFKTLLAEADESRGYGSPRGLGGDTAPAGGESADDMKGLEEAFQDLGLASDEAKIAATGR
ncbi:hypothetical protein ACFHW2_11880 [Actinomadura sp. LOL_016]|uniref:hypothetical protein n=1 Tax=unclassified Actinomadura TaxID=2626254 RepID=UPI003A800C46